VSFTPIQGQYPPIPTPFAGERIANQALADNIARWNDEPLEGYVVLGSNGEAIMLTDDERREVVRTARRAIPEGKRRMIVGAGREWTAATIGAVREAFDMGADAVLVGLPSYYKPAMTSRAIEAYYREVADASPGPVILYSVPAFTGIPIPPEVVAALAPHPSIVGIKDSAGDIENLRALSRIAREHGDEFSVLIGNAGLLAEGIMSGSRGAVLAVANVAPRQCDRIIEAARRGDAREANGGLETLLPLARLVTRTHGIGGLKAALDLLGYHGGEPRRPLEAPDAAAREEIAARLRDLGLLG
jgi:4-hydroxy-2-oxoglutarate aldolase